MPFYAKAGLISISAFAVVYTLYIGQQIIVPIVYATILAILLNPFVNFLTWKKLNRILAISIAVGLAVFTVLAIVYMLYSQISMFAETYPRLEAKFNSRGNYSLELTRNGCTSTCSKTVTVPRQFYFLQYQTDPPIFVF